MSPNAPRWCNETKAEYRMLRRLGIGSVDTQLQVAEQLADLAEGQLEDGDLALFVADQPSIANTA